MRRKNTWCLAVIIGIFCLMLNCAAASIRVNEVELNPIGEDSSNEWIELYSDSEVNLSGYTLKNNDNDIINLSGIFNGYFIFNFSSQWLDNSDEKIFLLYNESVINETPLFEDSANDEKTWQYCSGSWNFTNSSSGLVNSCQSQNSSENQSPQGTASQPAAVNLSVDYDDEVESEEFNVSVMLYNLKNMKYDIKVYITFEENDTVISQTFDGSWKSSTYYITDAVEGPGSETSEIKMKIKDDYSNFEGDAKINVRIRESETENSVASFEGSITIKKSEVSNRTSSNQGTVSLNLVRDNSSDRGITSNVIKLNSETANITKDAKSNIYKSKVEYFKQYGIYAFAIVCVAVIFVLLKKKKE